MKSFPPRSAPARWKISRNWA